jgi:hypothetical protein
MHILRGMGRNEMEIWAMMHGVLDTPVRLVVA